MDLQGRESGVVNADEEPRIGPDRRPEVWVVVAAYNEAGRIGGVLDGLLRRWPNIVVVDDASTDRTVEEVRMRSVWLLRHFVNLGQGAALQTGLDFALGRGAAYLVTFDADGQHRPEDIDALVTPLVSGTCDFTLGSRFLGEAVGIPATRKALLKLAVFFTRVFSGVRLTDTHNGLRGMTRRGAGALRITLNRMEHASQMLEQIHSSRLRYAEVPVAVTYSADSLAKGQPSHAALKLAARLFLEKVSR